MLTPYSAAAVIEKLMPEHKFKIGELVQLTRTAIIDAARGRYEIVRLLPEVDGVPLYPTPRILNEKIAFMRMSSLAEQPISLGAEREQRCLVPVSAFIGW